MYKKKKETISVDDLIFADDEPTITVGYVKLPKWVIEADLTMEQHDGAIKLLESGMKPRKVAALFGIHRSKIRLA